MNISIREFAGCSAAILILLASEAYAGGSVYRCHLPGQGTYTEISAANQADAQQQMAKRSGVEASKILCVSKP
ncbi:hypothetical protein [Pseudomonas salomonii]|jgi:hypothetical protein|uniref:DUF4124 domain-containing protein n=1 Tax=Pseudomonas salomonii TaxID=191391 RepID=A0ABS9GRF5_9PSED|nr:hypothetical protein [Pseudomonas salomonii]MCF5548288.1 hypothetical protein [Pseudomonas salomonii]